MYISQYDFAEYSALQLKEDYASWVNDRRILARQEFHQLLLETKFITYKYVT